MILGFRNAVSFLFRSCLTSILASCFLGCATSREKPLTFGLYDVPQEALQQVKEAGFDVVTGTANSDFLKAAQSADLKVLATSSVLVSGTTRAAVTEQIQQYDQHPALWGWYLTDEPDMNDISPRKVNAAARFVQRKSKRPGIVTVASGNAAKAYGKACDYLFVDFYPVAWSPVARFAKEMRLASFARDEEPYMAVVQAFDWSHFPEVLGQTNGLRLPTIAEVRCMAYMALTLEARGLFFYSFQAKTWRLSESPLWPELIALVADLRRYAPLFDGRPVWWPTEIEYNDPSRMYNEVHDGIIMQRLYHLEKTANGLDAGYYFVVINTTGEQVGYNFRVPFSPTESIQIGDETAALAEGWCRRRYQPYEVAIIGPLQDPLF